VTEIEPLSPQPPTDRDRSTRLIVSGVFLCLLACCAFFFAVVTVASMLYVRRLPEVPETTQLGLGQVISGSLVYCIMGASLLTLGIGSIRRRRWARPLVLIVGWGWLVIGALVCLVMTAVLPIATEGLPPDPTARAAFYGCFGSVLGFLGIVVPLLLVGLYRGADVRATLAAHDPQERWTDRIPTPLLGLSFWLGFSAVSSLLSAFNPILLIGSRIVTGPIAVATYVATAVVMAGVAVGLARRSRIAWWTGVAIFALWSIGSAFTLPRVDFDEVMAQMNTAQPAGAPDMSFLFHDPRFFVSMALVWLGTIGYFVYVRRYLR